jgi:oligopeptide transport system substrate-binding protein
MKRHLVGAAMAAALVAGCGGSERGDGTGDGAAPRQEITVNWGAEPPSLDPGLATDTTSSNILFNIMDPLVKLDDDLNAVANLARRWDISEDGTTVTFHLRPDGEWTNGDPVTAQDFEYSWKRTMSPELAADYAYQFYGIVGAAEYNGCETGCDALADEVGVNALDRRTLEVQLTTPQPWFIQQVAHTSFLAVHRPTVERFGDRWTEPQNIVTNGPFELAEWRHSSTITLTKWKGWRDAADVKLERVDGRMITDALTAVQAFESDETDVDINGPGPQEIDRWKGEPEYEQYPALGIYYYGVNVENVTDVDQRRAMSMALDRQAIIDNVAKADQVPANGITPQGMPGFDQLNPESPWAPPRADVEAAKELMAGVDDPKTDITIYFNNSPGNKEIAVAVQAQWQEIGINAQIREQEWAQFLEFVGPPPDPSVDVYRSGWIGDYPDAINFLELWTCDSGNNNSNFCDPEYDRLLEQARGTRGAGERYAIYGQMEDRLFGQDGSFPVIPMYWYTYPTLEDRSVKESFKINLLNQTDLTVVEVVDAG